MAHVRRGDLLGLTKSNGECVNCIVSIESYKRAMRLRQVDSTQVIWISDDPKHQASGGGQQHQSGTESGRRLPARVARLVYSADRIAHSIGILGLWIVVRHKVLTDHIPFLVTICLAGSDKAMVGQRAEGPRQ